MINYGKLQLYFCPWSDAVWTKKWILMIVKLLQCWLFFSWCCISRKNKTIHKSTNWTKLLKQLTWLVENVSVLFLKQTFSSWRHNLRNVLIITSLPIWIHHIPRYSNHWELVSPLFNTVMTTMKVVFTLWARRKVKKWNQGLARYWHACQLCFYKTLLMIDIAKIWSRTVHSIIGVLTHM